MAPATLEAIGPDRLGWLKALPAQWSEGDLAVTQAAPTDLWRAPLATASDIDLVNTYAVFGTSVVVYGHIHHSYVRNLRSFTVANAGSVSLSYDGDPRAAYLLVDDDGVLVRRVAYDRQREVVRLAEIQYPFAAWLGQVLQTGRYVPPPQP